MNLTDSDNDSSITHFREARAASRFIDRRNGIAKNRDTDKVVGGVV